MGWRKAGQVFAASRLAAGCIAEGDVDTSAGRVLIGDGSLAAPSVAFKNNDTSGLRNSAGAVKVVAFAGDRLTVGSGIQSHFEHSMLGDLAAQGGFRLYAETVKTADYQATSTDNAIVMDVTLGGTVTLPAAPSVRQRIAIRNQNGTNALTIARAAGVTINGADANLSLAASSELVLLYVDTNVWYAVG